MVIYNDPMIKELRQIRNNFWSKSGYDLKKTIDIIKKEAQTVIHKLSTGTEKQQNIYLNSVAT